MTSKIPKLSLKASSPLTDDEKMKTRAARSKTGAIPKIVITPKSGLVKNGSSNIQENKIASSNQIEKKVNTRPAAHSGMLLNLNPKKVTIAEPFKLGKIKRNENEVARSCDSKHTSKLGRTMSFQEKKIIPCSSRSEISQSSKPKKNLTKVSVKNIAKAAPSVKQSNDDQSKKENKFNRSKTEPAIKLGKTSAIKDEIKSATEKTEQNPLTLTEFVSPEFSASVAGRISPASKKNATGHSGMKFIPKVKGRKSYFNLGIKREEASQKSEENSMKSD